MEPPSTTNPLDLFRAGKRSSWTENEKQQEMDLPTSVFQHAEASLETIPLSDQTTMSSVESGKGSGLTTTHGNTRYMQFRNQPERILYDILHILVCRHLHEPNQLLLMACSSKYIILCKNTFPRLDQCSLAIIERFDRTEHRMPWQESMIIDVACVNEKQFFVFTQYELMLYSLDSFEKLHAFNIFKDTCPYSSLDHPQRCLTEAVSDRRAFYIHLNEQSHRILSVVDCDTRNSMLRYDLNTMFPGAQQLVNFSVTADSIQFLVELPGSQYAVHVCSLGQSQSMKCEKLIRLSYADKSSQICPVYSPKFQKHHLVIDRRKKVLDLLSREKYLQSYPFVDDALGYTDDKNELIAVSKEGICSISLIAN